MSVHTVSALRSRFGTEVPPVLWSPPDPRIEAAPPGPETDLSDDELTALRVLAVPEVRLEGRATGDLDSKLCLARAGELTARVVRAAGTADVDLPYCDGSVGTLARLVEPLIGTAPAADPAVAASFPAAAGRTALACGGDAGEIAAELRRIGVESEAARLIGRTFARSSRSVEFTFHERDRRIAVVVAVIDGPAGRIVALTATDGPGEGWIAIAEGTAHRIGRALRRACEELPGGGWMP
ncbi:ESX secretion-associated protein EspG [Tsukamurella strandjordii]|uniref:ESX secretion-associated protein EspG n=1 Tax=Tsukamurella strandjordii TaxID=147577 RepID=A0AA90NP12_9ACTN|nr:ESX secretion-associated protein EspG [Tsukamurella strandjordii]MDP0398044.1 ESX secretion-associated protein EspG [Tsukamurella strandjordii]